LPVYDWSTRSDSNPSQFTPDAISKGSQDKYIAQWATDAAAFGKPMVVVLDWEFNGGWYSYYSPKVGGITADSFVAMWRRVVNIFRKQGASNVMFAWVPNIDPKGHLAKNSGYPLKAMYPGDDYVDIVGLDGYNFGGSNWQTFEALYTSSYNLITSLAVNKPVMIKEIGCVEAGGDKAQWITDMFATLKTKFPKVKILLWYDEIDYVGSKLVDWPLDSSPSAAQAFADGIASSDFYSGSATNLMAAPSRLKN